MRPPRLILLPLLLALSTGLGWYLEQQSSRPDENAPPLVYLPPPVVARAASLGHETLLADYYWLQALQYYGEELNRPVYYRDLHRFLDLVVTLDPDFEYAYRFGGTVLPYNSGSWTWHNVPASVSLLERGVARFPGNWFMWMQLGFNKGIIGDDLAGAAEAYAHAAAAPGAPAWIPRLVTRMQAASGSLERARAYALQVGESTDDPELRVAMERRLTEIEVERQLRLLDRAVQTYTEREGEAPPDLGALVRKGVLDTLPRDPLGGTYRLEDGQVVSSSLAGGRLRPIK